MLDDLCFLERLVRPVLLYVAESLGGNVYEYGFAEFRNIHAALLEVRFAAHLPGWVELRCTGTVGVPPANLRALAGDVAFAGHSFAMLA